MARVMLSSLLSALAVLCSFAQATPILAQTNASAVHSSASATPSWAVKSAAGSFHPVVIWHGLGDSAYAQGMQGLADEMRNAFPGIFVHLVSLADSLGADQRAGFFGNVNEQIQQVCEQLASVDELRNGFDAVGFSQGGQFLRAYIERCNTPAVRNLVTFGSQHMGISDFPACTPSDLLCRLAEGALRGGIYSQYAQNNIVTAQYYRDPTVRSHYDSYLEANKFIADINNEVDYTASYKTNIEKLDNLVLLMFDQDQTVQPKQSSWFASYPEAQDEAQATLASSHAKTVPVEDDVVPLRQSIIYTEDRIGLRTLDKRGALTLDLCYGRHMQIDDECSSKVFGKFIGVAPPASYWPAPMRHAWARTVHAVTGAQAAAVPAELQMLSSVVMLLLLISISGAVYRSRKPQAIRLA